MRSTGSHSAPRRNRMGSRRAAPGATGCTTDRAAATTIRGARPDITECRTCNRRPIVSEAGERRSWGRVSQLGNCATSSSYSPASSSASSSHSRSVAVTTSSGARPASSVTRNGRSASGERTTAASFSSTSRTPARAGLAETAPESPDRAVVAGLVAVLVTRVRPPGRKSQGKRCDGGVARGTPVESRVRTGIVSRLGQTTDSTPADDAPPDEAAPAEVGSRVFTDRGIGLLVTLGSAIALVASFQLSLDKIRLLENPDYTPACNFSILMSCKSVINYDPGSGFGLPHPSMGLNGC